MCATQVTKGPRDTANLLCVFSTENIPILQVAVRTRNHLKAVMAGPR